MTFSYREVGATRSELPAGYRHVRRSRVLVRRDLDGAADALFGWDVQRGAGVQVAVSTSRAAVGSEVVQRLGVGPLALRAPCRVVYVIDEPDTRGFAYGTLPGHPEQGEESFVLTRDAAGAITLTITAFSRPASLLARLGGPVSRLVQDVVIGRYLHSLDR